jgi:cytochrome c peroxidase
VTGSLARLLRSTGSALLLLGAAAAWSTGAHAEDTPVVIGRGGAGEQARVELGRRLFFDPAVSRSGRQSCASCHLPEHGFSDPRPTSPDEGGATRRHSQTILFSDLAPAVHWNGEFRSVEALVRARLADVQGPRLVGSPSLPAGRPDVAGRPTRSARGSATPSGPYAVRDESTLRPLVPALEEAGLYASAFRAAFGTSQVTQRRIALAIADYVGSVRPGTAPYDRFVQGDESALSASAQRGLELFRGRAGCATCHDPAGGRFTDLRFHNTGTSWTAARPIPSLRSHVSARLSVAIGDVGRAEVERGLRAVRAFKTPTLRDVAVRAPYMHDAALATLRDVVEYYAEGCSDDPCLDRAIRPFEASPEDVADLVAFLEALTGETRAGMAPGLWAARPPRTRVRFVDAQGNPRARAYVQVVPAGDFLPGAGDRDRTELSLRTDGEGWRELEPNRRTPVALALRHTTVHVPDTCAEATITAP